jgi:putative transposase
VFAVTWLSESLQLAGRGTKCTPQVLWNIVLLAAARMTSLFAACRDLAGAPCDHAVRHALRTGLPKRARTLEEWFIPALTGQLPKSLKSRAWRVAIDWHLIPYHGVPFRHARELYHGKAKSGTTKFHAYATAYLAHADFRYTVAATSVQGNETLVTVLTRLLNRVSAQGIRIEVLLMDRQFCATTVFAHLQTCQIPFLVPLAFRGRKPKKRRSPKQQPQQDQRPKKLREFLQQPAGRYGFTWKVKRVSATFDVIVAYKSYTHERTGKRCSKKLCYAAWRVPGQPVDIRELYRKRFGIESSYRQLGQARIRTCTKDPLLRLFFVLVGLVLRNLWVWLHHRYFTERGGPEPTMHLERMRFRRMLNWIAQVVTDILHDGSGYCVELDC